MIPPSKIRATRIATKIPMIRFTVSTDDLLITLKFNKAELIAVVIVFTCVAFPVPNTVKTPKAENKTARKCQFLLSPFLI